MPPPKDPKKYAQYITNISDARKKYDKEHPDGQLKAQNTP